MGILSSLCYDGKLGLQYFMGTTILVFILNIPHVYFELIPNMIGVTLWGPTLYYILINIFLRLRLKNNDYQIAVRASFLGFIFALGLSATITAPTAWKPLGIYSAIMAFFHIGEFLGIAWSNPQSLSIESFILNHSVQYALAAVVSWIEFALELHFFPKLKEHYFCWIIGVVLCASGEIVRKLAMLTAKSNFNHLVQYVKSDEHILVTHGIYGLMRHPSYVGFFWWSIGTQIILANPICIVLYAGASWVFFNTRIYVEEITLLEFFGYQYHIYKKNVPTGLPFISGYDVENE